MVAQKGFLYEENAFKALKKYNISAGAGAAGASSDRPDLEIKLSGDKESAKKGCELKISPTAAGSLVMKFYNGKWHYGDYKGETEKEFLHNIGEKFNLLREMNTAGTAGAKWRGKIPYLQNESTGKHGKKLVGIDDKKRAYDADIAQFGADNEIHIDVPAKAVSDYYNTKKCQYLNVGTHGFYLLNSSDPLKLNTKLTKLKLKPIPDFGKSAKCKIRVRCQYKGGGDYQFVMTLQFSSVIKSPYNIAPIESEQTMKIDEKSLSKDPILTAFRS
jgi:hypothetical protein